MLVEKYIEKYPENSTNEYTLNINRILNDKLSQESIDNEITPEVEKSKNIVHVIYNNQDNIEENRKVRMLIYSIAENYIHTSLLRLKENDPQLLMLNLSQEHLRNVFGLDYVPKLGIKESKELLEALKGNTHLTALYFYGSLHADEETYLKIKQAIATHPSIKETDLSADYPLSHREAMAKEALNYP